MQRRFILAPLFAAVLLAACGGGTPAPQPTPFSTSTPPPSREIVVAPGAPITIGLSVALSGDQQAIGQDIADAADLSLADFGGTIKGHQVVTSRKDDGCANPQMAVSVAHTFIATAGLAGVIGPMCTTGAQAADAVYEGAHVVHISTSVTRDELSQQGEQYFFRASWRDDQQAQVQAHYAYQDLQAKTAFLVDDGRPYGKGLLKTFMAEYRSLGGQVTATERIAPGTNDFRSLAQQVVAAHPDLVLFEGMNPEAALLIKALAADSYAGHFMAPDSVFSIHDFIEPAGTAAEGVIVSAGPLPDLAFIGKFHDRFQRYPGTAFVLESYSAMTALLRAIDATATTDGTGALHIDRARLAQQMRATKMLSVTGVLAFDEHGDRTGDQPADVGIALYRVENGQFTRER